MIQVTKLNGKDYFLNSEWIESLESTPDTVVTLRDGKKMIVTESPEEIVEKIIAYKKRIFTNLPIIK